MLRLNTKAKLTFLIALLIWLTISFNGLAILICNKIALASFQDQNAFAEELVTKAGIRYFEALAWSENGLAEVEIGSLSKAEGSFAKASDLLAEAFDLYEQVIAIGRRVGIKPTYVQAMKGLDYDKIQKEHGLQSWVWSEVATLGRKGDVLGLFQRMQQFIKHISDQSEALANMAAKGAKPSLEQITNLTEAWQDSTTFGHYTVILARAVEQALGR
jgi:hypothetical protein